MKTKSILSAMISLTTSLVALNAPASQQDLNKYTTNDFIVGHEFLGCQPKGMKVNHSGDLLYVAEMCGKKINGIREATVSVIDVKSRKLKSTIVTPEGSRPYKITTADGRELKQAGDLGNTEVEMSIDGKYAMAVRCEGPIEGQTPGQIGSLVFPGSGMVTVIDDATGLPIKYIPAKGQGSKIITARPIITDDVNKTQIIYVVNYFSDDISVLDITNLKNDGVMDGSEHFKTKFKVHSAFFNGNVEPRGLVFTKDGKNAFALSAGAGSIFVIDAVNHKKIAELAPISETRFPKPNGESRPLNLRHIVLTQDGKMGYLSHMRGDGITRINMEKLLVLAKDASAAGKNTLPESTWDEILVPFKNGKSFIALPHYPRDYPTNFPQTANFLKLFDGGAFPILPDSDWGLTRPNTIVLDPVKNRYLYVSHRTDTSLDYTKYSPLTKGKLDILDTWTGEVIISLVGGSQPTALEVSKDNKVLMSAGFKDHENNVVETPALTFFDLEKIIAIYEKK